MRLIPALVALAFLAAPVVAEEAKPAATPPAEAPKPPPPPPDEVKLKNGDRLTGTVTSLAGGKLVINTLSEGTVTVDWTQVASVKTSGKIAVKMATGEIVEGKLVEAPEGRIKVATEGAAAPVEIEFAKVSKFNEPPTQWHGSLNLSAKVTDGNTHNQSFLFAAEATRATENDLFMLRAIFLYGKKNGVLDERNAYGLAKYNYEFYKGLYGYLSAEFLSDRFKDLNLNTTVSAGVGYEVFKKDWIDLTTEVGIAYMNNDFVVAEDEGHIGGRAAARLRVALPLNFEFRDNLTVYPNFEHSQDWQARNEATLGTALGGGWSLLGGVITQFDNKPSPGFRKYDDTYFLGLGYTF
jgi:putative salt-induced outer membrane protein YdiY